MGLFGGGGGGGFAGALAGSLGGQPAQITPDGILGAFGGGAATLGNTLTGTSKDAGILGVGQYKATGVGIDGKAFGDKESEARQSNFAKQLNEAQGRQAPTVDQVNLGKANTVTAATIGNEERINAAKLGPAATMSAATVAPTTNAQAASIDQSQQAQFRAGQSGLAAQLQAQAAGQGPSLAQSQLQQGTNRNIAQAMALAASQRGSTAGQGLRQIAQQTTAANQQAAQQSADLRMQEQMAARQQLAGVLGQGREADIGLAASQAQLQQQAALQNADAANTAGLAQAQLAQQASMSNQDALNQFASQQAQLSQQASLANQAANNQFMLEQAGLTQQAGLANQAAKNQFALEQGNLTLQGRLANQNAALQQTGLNDAQGRFLNQGMMDMEERDRQAAMAQQQLAVQQNLGLQGINSGAYAVTSKARGDLVGKLGEGAASMAGGMAGGGVVGRPDVNVDFARYLATAPSSEDVLRQRQADTDKGGGGAAGLGKALGKLGKGMAKGGVVPGKAPVPTMDSAANDVVLTPLSPGEVVVPRTIAADEDKTVKFVRALRAQSEPASDPIQARIDKLESQLAGVLSRRVKRSA